MAKTILTVGFELHSDATHFEGFASDVSLLDWDIVLFRPAIDSFISYSDTYQGKPLLNDYSSFVLRERCEHWRREIKQAVDSGKTVVVFMSSLQEVYIDTGERQYSGTGRNRLTKQVVALHNNYSCIPLNLKLVGATGSAMKLTPLGAELLASYWAEFASVSEYKVVLPSDTKSVCLMTKHGDKPLGAVIRSANVPGALILMPDIEFDREEFTLERDGETFWTAQATQFAARMLSAVVGLDTVLRSGSEVTPQPDWATAKSYALQTELNLRSELLSAEREVENAQKRKEFIIGQLKSVGKLRGLLYEKGKALEYAILDALKILGFEATPYKQADSEFDVVFESEEGRLLGEAEGKDSKAINIDKLRQLAMNINEDLQREEVSFPAKGVLFGNGCRLTPPDNRQLQFTEKCVISAKASSAALVPTSDLYRAVQYLLNNPDPEYSRLCRKAMLEGVGIVTLPVPPLCALTGIPSEVLASSC